MSKDLIITSIHKYGFDQVRSFVNSIDMCGFDGIKAAVIYDLHQSVKNELSDRGFILFQSNLSGFLAQSRFMDIHLTIKKIQSKEDVDYVFCVDARDLVFQLNPSDYIRKMGSPSVVFSSEGVTYEEEEWNKNVMLQGYGQSVYERMKHKDVLNAGVIAGKAPHVIDIMLSASLFNRSNKVPSSDQVSYNLTAHPMLDDPSFAVATDKDGWATNLHVKVHGGKSIPLSNESVFVNQEGTPYCIVHQYDRSQELTKLINSKYGI